VNPQSKPARIFFDFEFLATNDRDGTGHLTPLSVGMCCGGKTLYLEYSADLDEVGRRDPWLIDNVIKHLRKPNTLVLPARYAAARITRWVQNITHKPEFWAYRCASDWACLFNTYGGFIHMPRTFGRSCRDLGFAADRFRHTEHEWPPEKGSAHNALDDALKVQRLYKHLVARFGEEEVHKQ